MTTRRDLTALPKAHLHLHLEGSARMSTITELAERDSIPLHDLMAFTSLTDFMDSYSLAASTIRRPEDVERLCYELLLDEASQGVRWCEPFATPQTYEGRFGDLDEVWELMRSGFQRAADETGVGWGVIVNHVRTHPVEKAERIAVWAATQVGNGVVGFGLAGDEQRVGPEPYARAFAIAAEAGLLLAPHAGETAGAASVRGALGLGAHRVAHGVRAVEDPELLRQLSGEGIACDVCVTSNLKLAVVAATEDHPLPALLDADVPVTLGSDDQLFFGSLVAQEYELVRRTFGLADSELADIARTSVRVSGAPAPLKTALAADIDAWEAA